jgi:integrase
MRRGELLALRWADVDWDARRITVRHSRVPVNGGDVIETSTKTNRVRVVDLDEETLATLRAVRRGRPVVSIDDRSAFVFTDAAGEPLNPNSVSYLFRIAVQRARLRLISFHGLRHTHATALLDAKVPLHVVSRRLGHANPTITLNVYSHVMPGAQAEAVAAVQRPSPKSP